MRLLIKRLDLNLPEPRYAFPGDAGLDLFARENATLVPGARVVIGTGVSVAIPDGYAGFVQPRSGLAASHGITVLNGPGLIDSGYRDEVRVILVNHDESAAYVVKREDRIAQLVIVEVPTVEVAVVDTLPESARGPRGFGESGR